MKVLMTALCVLVLLILFYHPFLVLPLAIAFCAGFFSAIVVGESLITSVRRLFLGR